MENILGPKRCVYLNAVTYGYKQCYKVSHKELPGRWPILTTLFIYWSWDLSSRSILFFTFRISQAFQTKHRAVHPHGVQQRPHKQAWNKTGFVSWGKGAGQLEKNSITNFFPSMINYWKSMFPVLTKFLKGKEKRGP